MTSPAFGLLLAFVALFSWGFGDFFIQRTTRLVGDWKALFYITVVGFIGLFPLIKNQLSSLAFSDILFPLLLGIISFLASLVEFEALKKGKIAIIEPIFGLELPMIVLLSIFFVHERISLVHLGIIALVFFGILLVTLKQRIQRHHYRFLFEKGTLLAFMGAVGLALDAVLVGVSSKLLSPLLVIWLADGVVALLTAIYLINRGTFKNFITDIRAHPVPVVGQSVLDNVAWVAFGFSTSMISISATSAISESYIALTVLLGIFINREKIRPHQILGIILAVFGVILLSVSA